MAYSMILAIYMYVCMSLDISFIEYPRINLMICMYVYIYGINNMIWIRGYHMGHKTYNMIYSGCNGIFHGISNRIFYRIEKHM